MSSAPARSVAPPRVLNIEDLRRVARRRMPRVVFDYIDGGAERERTLKENCRAYEDVLFRPRSAVATRQVDLRTSVLGTTIDLPFMLAPVGSSRLFWPRGDHRTRVVSALSRRRPRRGTLGDRAGEVGGLSRAGRHHRHAGGGAAG